MDGEFNMRLGYNTNGFAFHRLIDAIEIIGEIGYECVAITLDHHALNPYDANLERKLSSVREALSRARLSCVIETGARFLLDARRKHQPTLVSPTPEGRRRRLDFLERAVDIAAALEAEAVSFWAGAPVDAPSDDEAFARLADGCTALCGYAESVGVRLAFEPEPGMLVETMDAFARLAAAVNHPQFGLTLDVGHIHCLGDGDIARRIGEWRDRLFNVHIEDMRRGRHDHLFFGEGEIDFPPVLRALEQAGYAGPVNVELSRHSHDAVRTATRAFEFLAAVGGTTD